MTECLTTNLRLELDRTNLSLQRWTERRMESLDSSQRNFDRMMEECQFTIATLQENEVQLEDVKQLNNSIRNQQLLEINYHNAAIESLCEKKSVFERQLSNLEQEELAEVERMEMIKKDHDEKKTVMEKSMNDMTHGISRFSALGLQFQRAHNQCIQFIFTQIDPTNNLKEFSFSLLVDEQERYRLVDCSPALDQRSLYYLCNELNQDNKISKFVFNMRKEFCKLVGR